MEVVVVAVAEPHLSFSSLHLDLVSFLPIFGKMEMPHHDLKLLKRYLTFFFSR